MAKKTITFRENSFAEINPKELLTTVKSISRDPHFTLNQKLIVKSVWGLGHYDVIDQDGKKKDTPAIGLMCETENGTKEFVSMTMFKGKTKTDITGAEFSVNPNKVERDEDVVAHVPNIGDTIYFVGRRYINAYNRQTVCGVMSWTAPTTN